MDEQKELFTEAGKTNSVKTQTETPPPQIADEDLVNLGMHELLEPGLLDSSGMISPEVGKPAKGSWFMSHPTYASILTIARGMVGSGKQARVREYLVQGETENIHTKLVENLDDVFSARAVLTCNTSGFFSIWNQKVGDGESAHIAHITAENAWRASQEEFIKIHYTGNEKGYDWKIPESTELFSKKKPKWPDQEVQSWNNILGKAYKSRIIRDLDHPVYLSAIGRHI